LNLLSLFWFALNLIVYAKVPGLAPKQPNLRYQGPKQPGEKGNRLPDPMDVVQFKLLSRPPFEGGGMLLLIYAAAAARPRARGMFMIS